MLGAVALQATFQALPIFLSVSKHVVALQALGAGILLLLWLYVMANVIVFGAEVNWWVRSSAATARTSPVSPERRRRRRIEQHRQLAERLEADALEDRPRHRAGLDHERRRARA